jgi:hypothetical protein
MISVRRSEKPSDFVLRYMCSNQNCALKPGPDPGENNISPGLGCQQLNNISRWLGRCSDTVQPVSCPCSAGDAGRDPDSVRPKGGRPGPMLTGYSRAGRAARATRMMRMPVTRNRWREVSRLSHCQSQTPLPSQLCGHVGDTAVPSVKLRLV